MRFRSETGGVTALYSIEGMAVFTTYELHHYIITAESGPDQPGQPGVTVV